MTDETPPRRALWSVAIVATLGMSVSYIDRQAFSVLGPDVMKGLNLDLKAYGWLQSAFPIAYLVGAPLAGIVVDRLGARKGFAVAVVLWSLVAAAHSLAAGFASMFVLRLMLGLAEAPSFPSAIQSVRRAIPGAKRSIGTGLVFAGSSIGVVIAAPLAIGIASRFGFRFAFVGTALVAACWIPIWLLVSRRMPDHDDTEIIKGAPSAYRGPELLAAPKPRWRDVVLTPTVLRATFIVVGSSVTTIFATGFSAVFLKARWGLTPGQLAGILIVPAIAADIGTIGFGWLMARGIKVSRLMLAAAGLATVMVLGPLAPNATLSITIIATAVAGVGGMSSLVTSDMMNRVPVRMTSSVGGIFAAAQSLCHMTVAPLIGATAQDHGWSPVMVGVGLAALPMTMVFVLWPGFRDE